MLRERDDLGALIEDDDVRREHERAAPRKLERLLSRRLPSGFVLATRSELVVLKSYLDFRSAESPWRLSLEDLVNYGKVLLALAGTLVIWVGAWDIITPGQQLDGDKVKAIFPNTLRANLVLLFVGMLLIISTDSFFGNVFMDTPLNPRMGVIPRQWMWWNTKWYNPRQRMWRTIARDTLAGIGMFTVWTVLYVLLDTYLYKFSVKRDIAYFWIGQALLVLSRTYCSMSMVFPPETETRRQLRSLDSITASRGASLLDFVADFPRKHGVATIRCLVSFVAQNLIWVSTFNLLAYNFSNTAPYVSKNRALLYALLAILGYMLTGSLVLNSWVDWEPPVPAEAVVSDKERVPLSLLFCLRCFVALQSQMMYWVGMWLLLDLYLIEASWWRNVLYVVIGIVMLYFAGTLETNMCVEPTRFITFGEDGTARSVTAEEMAQEMATSSEAGILNGSIDSELDRDDWGDFSENVGKHSPGNGHHAATSAAAPAPAPADTRGYVGSDLAFPLGGSGFGDDEYDVPEFVRASSTGRAKQASARAQVHPDSSEA